MYPPLRLCHVRPQAKPASAGFWQADWDIELLWPGGQKATLGGRILRILSVPPLCPHRVPTVSPPCPHAWGWLAGERILSIAKSDGEGGDRWT